MSSTLIFCTSKKIAADIPTQWRKLGSPKMLVIFGVSVADAQVSGTCGGNTL